MPKVKYFCVHCFIDSDERNWSCLNCGASNSVLEVDDWVLDEIQRNACWWGRQHRPDAYYLELMKELKMLRSMQTEFHGRRAIKLPADDSWAVVQKVKVGDISVIVNANSAEEALEKTKADLPYVICDHPDHVTIKS